MAPLVIVLTTNSSSNLCTSSNDTKNIMILIAVSVVFDSSIGTKNTMVATVYVDFI